MRGYGEDREEGGPLAAMKKYGKWLGGGAAVGLLALNSMTIVDETERGLTYRFSKLLTKDKSELRQPGLNFHWPWETIKEVRTDLQHIEIKDMHTYTKDNQPITLEITPFFKLEEDNLVNIYRNNPDWETKLVSATTDAVKSALGHTEAQNVAQHRDSIMIEVTKETATQVQDLLNIGVASVLMPNYDFNDEYETAVAKASNEKAALNAKQTQYEQSLIDKKKKIVDAEAASESEKLKADGEAYATLTRKKAESEGFKLVQGVIGEQNMGTYLFTSNWDGKTPVAVGTGNFFDVSKYVLK